MRTATNAPEVKVSPAISQIAGAVPKASATSPSGFCDYLLTGAPGAWRIAKKKVTLLSDCVPSYCDLYQL